MIRAATRQCVLNIRLYFRNPLALSYGYLFPTIFLIAYWALYRYDRVPLVRHMGELLTVTVLGGACFGLPTTFVSERERGVWRRYRLMPVPVAATRHQHHRVAICAADNRRTAATRSCHDDRHAATRASVRTVAGIHRCVVCISRLRSCDRDDGRHRSSGSGVRPGIFLPMLVIGGIAVPIASLPVWAQHASAFFPGRYAVEALQSCVSGVGVDSAVFNMIALLVIGIAGSTAGSMMFRWDEHERFAARRDHVWVALALAAWAVVGVFAESRGYTTATNAVSTPPPSPRQGTVDIAPAPLAPGPVQTLRATPAELAAGAREPAAPPSSPAPVAPKTVPVEPTAHPSSWEGVTEEDIYAALRFDQLPPDEGIITPIASAADRPDSNTEESVGYLARRFQTGHPARSLIPFRESAISYTSPRFPIYCRWMSSVTCRQLSLRVFRRRSRRRYSSRFCIGSPCIHSMGTIRLRRTCRCWASRGRRSTAQRRAPAQPCTV